MAGSENKKWRLGWLILTNPALFFSQVAQIFMNHIMDLMFSALNGSASRVAAPFHRRWPVATSDGRTGLNKDPW